MKISLVLSSGDRISNALSLARQKFDRLPWHLYDGVPSDPNRIEAIDYAITIAMSSRANSAGLVNVMRNDAADLSKLLRKVPTDVDLVHASPAVETAITELLRATTSVGGVGISVATKMLHRKRPRLIPMIDSVICAHYKPLVGRLPLERGARALAFIQAVARDARSNDRAIRTLRSKLVRERQVASDASPLRIFEATLYEWANTR